ncbi:MAG: hypothetical protein L3J95_05045 [Thermoplasmata archaeon]|nr:hypothetical protein [Thermoplasmata archaeon]MCI4359767.1 hypothetical protein [Thermoplasmata archaeon]
MTHGPLGRRWNWRSIGRLVGWGAALLSLFVASASAGAETPAAAPLASAVPATIAVNFPSAYPDVTLSEVGNRTTTTSLSVDQILEATPSASAPQIVAVALPSNIVVTSGSSGSSSLPFDLTATLTVYQANAGLWQGPNDLVQADGSPLGTAHLSIDYALNAPADPSQGVGTHWVVSGWPWVASSDLLGIQMSLSTPLAHSFVACTGSEASVDQVGCPGATLVDGTSQWTVGVLGIQGNVPGGPTSIVRWDRAFGSSSAPSNPSVSVGVLVSSPALSHLLVAAPGEGAGTLSGNLSFSLLTPIPGLPAPQVLHGQLGWFIAGGGASAAAGIVGILAFRSRQRGIEREL